MKPRAAFQAGGSLKNLKYQQWPLGTSQDKQINLHLEPMFSENTAQQNQESTVNASWKRFVPLAGFLLLFCGAALFFGLKYQMSTYTSRIFLSSLGSICMALTLLFLKKSS